MQFIIKKGWRYGVGVVDTFLTNFFKVMVFTLVLPLRLCHFFFLHNSVRENHCKYCK